MQSWSSRVVCSPVRCRATRQRARECVAWRDHRSPVWPPAFSFFRTSAVLQSRLSVIIRLLLFPGIKEGPCADCLRFPPARARRGTPRARHRYKYPRWTSPRSYSHSALGTDQPLGAVVQLGWRLWWVGACGDSLAEYLLGCREYQVGPEATSRGDMCKTVVLAL